MKSRVEENAELIEFISKRTMEKEVNTYAEVRTQMLTNSAISLSDISKSLAVIADALNNKQQERVGEWIDGHCSLCGCDIPAYIEDYKWVKDMNAKYCPNCGAKMKDGKNTDENQEWVDKTHQEIVKLKGLEQ